MKTTAKNIALADLHAALRASADGDPAASAAVELLISHNTWLRRGDFRRYLKLDDVDDVLYARVDYAAVEAALDRHEFAGSGSEVGVLRIACGLVNDFGIGELVSSLDSHNLGLVMNALARRRSWHEDGRSTMVNGWFDRPGALPFETHRSRAYAAIGDVEDELRGDWPDLSSAQRAAVRVALKYLGHAKDALNEAALG